MSDETKWSLLRVKRRWVPEWLWKVACRNPDPSKRLPLSDPWRTLLTRQAHSIEEALSWWQER